MEKPEENRVLHRCGRGDGVDTRESKKINKKKYRLKHNANTTREFTLTKFR